MQKLITFNPFSGPLDRSIYEEINGGIHRKPAGPVGVPSITRYLPIWTFRTKSEYERVQSTQNFINQLCGQLLSNINIQFETGDEPNAAKIIVRPFDRGNIFLFRFRWRGLSTNLRIEPHTEYIAITAVIDLSIKPINKNGNKLKPIPTPDGDKIYVESDYYNLSRSLLKRDRSYRLIHQKLFDKIWKAFDLDVYGSINVSDLGHHFADFRGFITGPSDDEIAKLEKLSGPKNRKAKAIQATMGVGKDALGRLFSRSAHVRGRGYRHQRPPKSWKRVSIGRLWPFLAAELLGSDFEFTVSGFLGGRAIYASALGPPPLITPLYDDWTPVCYHIHSYTDDPWQIGRLIDRVHYLGTSRLAASLQINDLQRVSADLGEMETRATKLQIKIHNLVRGYDYKNRINNMDDIQIVEQEIAKLQGGLAQLSVPFQGDIGYRIQRSRYYITEFSRNCLYLREKRIEGYQPYAEFVMRRLGASFNYVELLSVRINTFKRDLFDLNEQFVALKMTMVTHDIRELADSITHRDSEIENIQGFGELVLLLFLAPYYASNTIFSLIMPIDACKVPGEGHGGAPDSIAFAIMIFGVVVLFREMGATQRRRANQNRSRSNDEQLGLLEYVFARHRKFWPRVRWIAAELIRPAIVIITMALAIWAYQARHPWPPHHAAPVGSGKERASQPPCPQPSPTVAK